MTRRNLYFLPFLFLCSCLSFKDPEKTEVLGVGKMEIKKYRKNMSWRSNEAFSTPEKYKLALGKRSQFPENTRFYASYNRTGYEFIKPNYAEDFVEVKEINQEHVVSLRNGAKYVKVEYINDNISADDFLTNYCAEESDQSFVAVASVTTQANGDGIFHSDAKKVSASWELPAPGSAVIIRNAKTHKDVKYLTTVYFHEYYPQEERIVTFKIPRCIDIEILERNLENYQVTKTSEYYDVYHMPKAESVKKDKSARKKEVAEEQVQRPDTGFTYITYTIKNLKALKDEDLFPGPSHDLPHLMVLCKAVDTTVVRKLHQYTEQEQKLKRELILERAVLSGKEDEVMNKKRVDLTQRSSVIANTDDLYNWFRSVAMLSENKPDSVKKITDEIIKDARTDLDKVKAIFYWVQDNIRYIAFEDGISAYKPDACQNVLANRYGDCKGMANLMKWMLKSQGYDARLTWIGTHRLSYDYSIPTLASSNHMICALNLNGKRFFLDATEKFIGLEDYAHRIQGRPVMIEDSINYIIDTVPDLAYTRNEHNRKATFRIMPDGKLTGTMTETIMGENKTSLLNRYHYAAKADRQEVIRRHLRDNDPNVQFNILSFTDLNNREIDQQLKYDITINYNVKKSGNRIYLRPDYIGELTNHENDTDRLSSMSYNHKLYYTHNYVYEVPAGYKLKSLPKDLSVNTQEYQFRITYKTVGNTVVYTKELILKTGFVSMSSLRQWNADITLLGNKYKEFIVFEK